MIYFLRGCWTGRPVDGGLVVRAILRRVVRVRSALGAGVAWSWLTPQRRDWIERRWVQFFNLFLNVVRHVVWVFQAFACCVFLVVRFVCVCVCSRARFGAGGVACWRFSFCRVRLVARGF